MPEAPEPHLSQLIKAGQETTVVSSDGTEYTIFIARPSALQQDEARKKANAKAARYMVEANDGDSDAAMSLRVAFEGLPRDELMEMRLRYEENDARQAAYNIVLWHEDSEWGNEDKYISLVAAIADRIGDIEKYNSQMLEAVSDDHIDPSTDEVLQTLMAEQNRFNEEVDQVKEAELQVKRAKFDALSDKELLDDCIKQAEELERRMLWHQEFQIRMLYYSCRYSDDRKKFYFETPEDVLEIPQYIRSQLFEAYEDVERGTGDLKNSLSLLSSLA